MPSYDFRCKECDEIFEITCSMSQREEKAVCPKCDSRNVEAHLTGSFASPGVKKHPFGVF
jgi:putative FmdB family regulatory protein